MKCSLIWTQSRKGPNHILKGFLIQMLNHVYVHVHELNELHLPLIYCLCLQQGISIQQGVVKWVQLARSTHHVHLTIYIYMCVCVWSKPPTCNDTKAKRDDGEHVYACLSILWDEKICCINCLKTLAAIHDVYTL